MNEQEAIDHINSMCKSCKYWYNGKCHEDGNCFEAMQMSIKALEKQIPQKVKYDEYGKEEGYPYCACGQCLIDDLVDANYCPNCGHKLDRSVKDE